MSFADSLLKQLRQAPVLGKKPEKGLSHMIGAIPETYLRGWKSENPVSFHLRWLIEAEEVGEERRSTKTMMEIKKESAKS